MSHAERIALAHSIKEALIRKWNDVEAVGLIGSVARGEDARWSDLDMICIVKSSSGKDDLFFVYQEVPIWIEVRSKSHILGRISEPMPEWPISACKWYDAIPLYDPLSIFQELRMFVDTLPQSFYIKGMEDSLLDALLELNKIRAAHEVGDVIEARDAAHRFAHNLALFIAYLNHTFYRRGFKSIFIEYKEFKLVPAHYGDEIHKLVGHVFVDTSTLRASAENLWVECLKTAESNSVRLRQLESLEEI